MKTIERILVGLALTPEGEALTPGSRRAALQAQWLAEKCGAALSFVHSTWADLHEEDGTHVPGLSPAGRQALEELCDEYRESGATVELLLSEERPWLDLIRRVQRGEGDLVMVARRNFPVSEALGSVALKLLRKCPAPVWVVKADAPLVQRSVLVATDLSPVGDLALEYGAFVARACGCELHVAHAWQVTLATQFRSDMPGHEEELARLQKNARARVEESVARRVEGVPVHVHVGRDAASRAILEGVERLGIDLLVMGTISRSGIAGLLVGNTAEKLLDKARCSILAIKPDGFQSPVRPA